VSLGNIAITEGEDAQIIVLVDQIHRGSDRIGVDGRQAFIIIGNMPCRRQASNTPCRWSGKSQTVLLTMTFS